MFNFAHPWKTNALDLIAVVAAVGAAIAVVAVTNSSLLRLIVGIPFVAVLPGYAVIAVVFPRISGSEAIDWLERFVLSTAASLSVVPPLTLLVSFGPLSLSSGSLLVVFGGFTLATTAVAFYRRTTVETTENSLVSRFGKANWRDLTTSPRDALLTTFVIAAAVAVVVAGITAIGGGYQARDAGTDFYLLSSDGDAGARSTAHPTSIARGENQSIRIGVRNNANRPIDYTIVTVSRQAGENTVISANRILRRMSVTVPGNEIRTITRRVRPGTQANTVVFLLYRNSPPENPTVSNAYRATRLRVTEEES